MHTISCVHTHDNQTTMGWRSLGEQHTDWQEKKIIKLGKGKEFAWMSVGGRKEFSQVCMLILSKDT